MRRILTLAAGVILAIFASCVFSADHLSTMTGDPTPENAPVCAELAVEAVKKLDGAVLDYSSASLKHIDRLVLGFRSKGYTVEKSQRTLYTFGCYVGEVMVRHLGAKWIQAGRNTAAPAGPSIMIQMKNGAVANPIQKVVQLLENGEEDSVVFFYMTAQEIASKRLNAIMPKDGAPH